jgi:SAM-dependent methyltransferase
MAYKTPETALPFNEEYAYFYNRYWAGSYSEAIFPAVERLLLKHLQAGRSRLLDVCCGTGQLVALLHKAGFIVDGLDGAEKMLAFAKANNSHHHDWFLADALSFKLKQKYHAVTSFCSSINHCCPTSESLLRLFKTVAHALQPGGYFLFDVVMEADLKREADLWKTIAIQGLNHAITSKGQYQQASKSSTIELQFEVVNKQNQRERKHITMVQRGYSQQAITQTLKKAGFTQVHRLRNPEDLALSERVGHRSFFIAQL